VAVSLAEGPDALSEGFRFLQTTAGSQREILLGPLAGGAKYRVWCLTSAAQWRSPAPLLARDVFVRPGQTVRVRFAKTDGASISGRVTGSDGKGLKYVNAMVRMSGGDVHLIGTVTDPDGNYTLAGVPPGTHRLELLRSQMRTTPG